MTKRKISYGVSNFEDLITSNYYYIDKTKYIELLEQVKWPVFIRPRRFGKTLFTQTLKWYYDIKAKDKFEQLFGNLYIGKNPTPKHNTFFVLSLNFSGMDTFVGSERELKEKFNGKVLAQIERFISYYRQEFNLDNNELSDFHDDYRNDIIAALNKILEFVGKLDGRLFITIDEYDSLTNALAIRYRYSGPDDNMYLKILQKGGFFRTFFEELKNGTESVVEQIFITGILPITIADMKRGFNIASWITFSSRFDNLLGITQLELDWLIDSVYSEYDISHNKTELKKTLKQYYNGYKFLEKSQDVYNPMMTLYFLNNIIYEKEYPADLTDRNTAIDYNQIAFLFGQNTEKRNEVIQEITHKKQIKHTSTLSVSFDMIDFRDGRYITEGLFYSGILTHGDSAGELIIPNIVTYGFALQYFERIYNFSVRTDKVSNWMVEYQRNEDIECMLNGFFRDVICNFPGQFFANANESFFHGMLFHILYNNMPKNRYEVIPEYNLPDGRADIMLRSYPNADVDVQLNHLFEIKQVPKSASDVEFNAKFKLGLGQMEKYLATESSHWYGIVVCFRGNKDFRINILSY